MNPAGSFLNFAQMNFPVVERKNPTLQHYTGGGLNGVTIYDVQQSNATFAGFAAFFPICSTQLQAREVLGQMRWLERGGT